MSKAAAPAPVQYITEENGKRVGVVLSWDDYEMLRRRIQNDPDLLSELSVPELEALAYSKLTSQRHARMVELLRKNDEAMLSEDEQDELNQLTDQVDQLNILKARALLTLRQLNQGNRESPEFL